MSRGSLVGMVCMLALVLGVVGCARTEPAVYATGGTSLIYADAVERARAADASEAQIAILERIASRGEATLADVEEALQGTYGCFDAAGIGYEEVRDTRIPAYPQIAYNMFQVQGLSLEQTEALANDCTREHSEFVEMLYQSQPQAVQAEKDFLVDNYFAGLKECFTQAGEPMDANATFEEVWDEAVRVLATAPNAETGDGTLAGCFKGVVDAKA